MRTQAVKLSSRYQILIPKRVREALGLRPGDRLLVDIDGGKVVLRPRPRSYSRHLRGLHKEIWQDLDATEHVRRERESWD